MRQKILKTLMLLGGVMLSSIALAEGEAEVAATGLSGATVGLGLIAISAALAIGMAVIGGALGQGKAAGAALEGIARNPSSSSQVFTPFILALVFIEFQVLLAFLIAIFLNGKV